MKVEATQVRRILQNKWGLSPETTTYYKSYRLIYDDEILDKMKSARVYRVTKQKLEEIMLES